MPWKETETSVIFLEGGQLRGLVRQDERQRGQWVAWRADAQGTLHRLSTTASKEEAQALVEANN